MGEVFRARDTRLNRDVAVKVLLKDFVADADRLRRFEQEAKTHATLNYLNILTIGTRLLGKQYQENPERGSVPRALPGRMLCPDQSPIHSTIRRQTPDQT